MAEVKVNKIEVKSGSLILESRVCGCQYSDRVHSPKLAVYFQQGEYIRRMPMTVEEHRREDESEMAVLYTRGSFVLDHMFQIGHKPECFEIWFALQYGAMETEHVDFSVELPQETHLSEVLQWRVNLDSDTPVLELQWNGQSDCIQESQEIQAGINRQGEALLSKINRHLFRVMYQVFKRFPVQKRKVFFLSNRRNNMSGNMDFVFRKVKDMPVKYRTLLKNCDMTQWHPCYLWKAAWHGATAKVILVDDSCNFLDFIDRRKETSLIQLWHACGAFKTFGYSRLGKSEGPDQRDRNHRFYTHAITSSEEIAKFYAEGFGIPLSHVSPTGVPRTDVFFEDSYKQKMQNDFYMQHPDLQDKKIILFAPTFRGWDKESAYYPLEQFDAVDFLESVGEEYTLIVKYHPYISQRYPIPEQYQDRILDMTESAEINDLLFVSDVVITDYSSVIFEASLLNIPMLFYAYDLEEYISARDFYYEFEDFVPGKIVRTQEELAVSIQKQDYEAEKIESFKKRFFDHLDGKSSERVAQLVLQDVERSAAW